MANWFHLFPQTGHHRLLAVKLADPVDEQVLPTNTKKVWACSAAHVKGINQVCARRVTWTKYPTSDVLVQKNGNAFILVFIMCGGCFSQFYSSAPLDPRILATALLLVDALAINCFKLMSCKMFMSFSLHCHNIVGYDDWSKGKQPVEVVTQSV